MPLGVNAQSAPPRPASPPSTRIPTQAPVATAGVSGTVEDAQGALISGAKATLTSNGDTGTRSTLSGADGRFFFSGIRPGNFTLSVTLQGFTSASLSGTLESGQNVDLEPFQLKIATVSFVVNAVPLDVLAAEDLHAEEQQRLAGILPNFFVSYSWTAPPLSAHQKFALATRNVADPGNLFLVGTIAGVQQAENAFPGYHQGAAGYGKRYGADLGNLVVGTYMGGAVLPALFKQDPRYFYKGTGTIRARFWYAVSRAVVSRGDNGRWQPAYASVLGDLSAGAISNIYYPASDRQGAALTLKNGFLGVAGDAMNDVFQEFFSKILTPKAGKSSSTSPVTAAGQTSAHP